MISPYGGKLVDLLVSEENAKAFKRECGSLVAIRLSKRQLCDLELLMNGAYSPLEGFMCQDDYTSVIENMCLASGMLWSIPITLDISKTLADAIEIGSNVSLIDEEGFTLALLQVKDIWNVNKDIEVEAVYGSMDIDHPGIDYLYHSVGDCYIGGKVIGLQLPIHYDFEALRNTPQELRHAFEKQGWNKVVAFGTCKPMHRLHHEVTLAAAKEAEANILIHPLVGLGKPGDLEYFSRVHCYQAIMKYYPMHMIALSLLPYATRMAGPRESIHNAIIRQNYGCSHIIIGPEHASPLDVRQGAKRFYERYSSQQLIDRYRSELAIKPINISEKRYVPSRNAFLSIDDINANNLEYLHYKDHELYEDMSLNREIPEWFTYPEVISELKKVFKPRSEMGLTLFFTGLSGSGKSTLAKLIYARFIEEGKRPVTLLDGDIVRDHLSSELGFSKEHRDINVKRIGFVASEINKNGGIAICAPIAPYKKIRDYVRSINMTYGAFIEIYIATPLDVCEQRDRKGLYAKARKGEIKHFTGISDPYEEPTNPELLIDTSKYSPMEAAQQIMFYLFKHGYIDS
jgi:sulfate adenylyltransferase